MLARRSFARLVSAAAVAAPSIARAREQYPSKSIRLVVPWPPGGGAPGIVITAQDQKDIVAFLRLLR